MTTSVRDIISGWGDKDLANLHVILGGKGDTGTIQDIEARFAKLYNSEVRKGLQNLPRFLLRSGGMDVNLIETSTPTYVDLLTGSAKHIGVFRKASSTSDLELDLSYGIIARALQRMSPVQRREFFETPINLAEVFEAAGVKSNDFSGPVTATAVIAAAQASGFGVYMASTTALGFVTHAVGITLPFAAYAGLSGSIATLIGPVGWLGVGLWGVIKVTGPNWEEIIKGLVYIVQVNSRSGSNHNSNHVTLKHGLR